MSDEAFEADYLKRSSVELDANTVKQEPSSGAEHATVDFPPGSIIAGKYRVISLLGKGGMGVVYKVEQIFVQQTYALKAILGGTSDFAWRRFQLEAKVLARLKHSSIIGLKDFGLISEGNPYFVTDFAQGETLASVLKESGALSVESAFAIFIPIAQALAHAHSIGVIHRDLKPSNVVVDNFADGGKQIHVKILDFGIAKIVSDGEQSLTATGEIFGSPYYMSPEQCSGSAIDERSDIYSFGCVLFEALTGAPPFMGDSALATLIKHQKEQPPTLKESSLGKPFAQGMENVLKKLLAKDADDRYQTFEEVLADLLELQSAPDSKSVALNHGQKRALSGRLKNANIAFGPASVMAVSFVILFSGLLVAVFNPEVWQNLLNVLGGRVPSTANPKDYDSSSPLFDRYFSDVPHQPDEHAFVFPQAVSLGTLKDLSSGRKTPAQGSVVFPAAHRLKFEPNFNMIEKPKYFKRFRPDDFQELSFKYLLPKGTQGAKFAGVDDVTDEDLLYMSDLTGIEELNLESTSVTDSGLTGLKGLSNLRSIDLSWSKCTAEGIKSLPQLLSLQEIEANGVAGIEKLPRYLEGSKHLEKLHILNDVLGGGLTDDDLKPLENIITLKDLSLACHSKIGDAGLKHLIRLENLEKLNLMSCSISPECGKYLSSLKRLRELRIDLDPKRGWTGERVNRLKEQLPVDCELRQADKSNAWQSIQRNFGEMIH